VQGLERAELTADHLSQPGNDPVNEASPLPNTRRASLRPDPFLVAALAAAALLVFLPALDCGFVYDDHADIRQVDNVFIPGGWMHMFSTASAQLYRPVKYLSYYLDNVLWGWNPAGWHLQSLLWHSANSALLFVLICRLGASRLAAGVGALWFALHPIHTEAVVWISSRASLLSTTGVLVCLIGYLRWRETARMPDLALLALGGLFGFFSKEDALMVIPLIAAYEVFQQPRTAIKVLLARRTLLPLAMLGFLALAYLVPRQLILSGIQQGQWEAGYSGVLATLPVILVTYLLQLIFPLSMSVDQPVDYTAGFGLEFGLCTVVLALLFASCFLPRIGTVRWRFSVCWFFVTLLPVMGLIPINQPRADRFLYLPSVSAAFLIAYGWDALQKKSFIWQRIASTAAAVWLIAFAVYSMKAVAVWRNEDSLWQHAIRANPRSYRAYSNLAATAGNRGEHQKALELIEQSLTIKPDYPEGMVTKAYALSALGKTNEAEQAYRTALASDPTNALWLYLLADHLARAGKLEAAEQNFDRVAELRPALIPARVAAGVLALRMKKPEKAIAHWQAVLKFDPGNEEARHNLSVVTSQPLPR
jgi:tetratricopeptide (TPR) repeat protein